MATGDPVSENITKDNVGNFKHNDCETENCLTILRSQENTFTYNDALCSSNLFYICERINSCDDRISYSNENIEDPVSN